MVYCSQIAKACLKGKKSLTGEKQRVPSLYLYKSSYKELLENKEVLNTQ